MGIGRLSRLDPREIWDNEASKFTPWLEQNVDQLDEVLELSLEVVTREKSTGSFRSDLLAIDGDGKNVVIECQLKGIDHDHIGKALTYLANLDAATVIWICSEAKPEYVNAIRWLNESTTEKYSFYLVSIAAAKIDGSLPAPLFTVLVKPRMVPSEVGIPKEELAEIEHKRIRFWEGLLEKTGEETNLYSAVSARPNQWLFAGAGKTGLTYMYSVSKKRADVLLRIYMGDKDENDRIFQLLEQSKDKIEQTFGEELDWNRDEAKATYFIGVHEETTAFQNDDMWEELQEKMAKRMAKLEKALMKHIDKL